MKRNNRSASLFIDTTDNKRIFLFLSKEGKETRKESINQSWSSQSLLPLLRQTLEETKTDWKEISQISVNTGPGSYTGIRVGIAVAMTLGWLLDIPVNGIKNGLIEPKYQ